MHEQELKLLQLNSRISVALSSEERANKLAPRHYLESCIIEPPNESKFVELAKNSVSFSLEEIFRFDVIIRSLVQRQTGRIIVCTGFETNRQARILMLLGCHMVLSLGMGFEEALLIFRPLNALIQTHFGGISAFEILLRAMCCAKCLNWIDFGLACNKGSESCIQMDEFIHYARSLQKT